MRWGLALIAVLALVAPASADNDKEIAAKLFKQGRDAMAAGKLDEACARFEQSLKLDAAIGTKLNLADCLEKKGKLADAYRLFDEAAVEAAKESKEGRESFGRTRADALVKKLVRIELRFKEPNLDGMTVTLDGDGIARAAWTKPNYMAPGTIPIVVSADGREPYKTVIDGVAGEVRIVDVPALERAGTGGGKEPDPDPDPGTGTGTGTADPVTGGGPGPGGGGPVDQPKTKKKSRALAYVVGGGGVALLGTSLALGLAARSKFNSAECGEKAGLPDNRCTEAGQATTDDARGLADIGTGLAIAGTVAVGVGVYLFLRARSHDSKPDDVVVAPVVSDDGVGVVVTVFR